MVGLPLPAGITVGRGCWPPPPRRCRPSCRAGHDNGYGLAVLLGSLATWGIRLAAERQGRLLVGPAGDRRPGRAERAGPHRRRPARHPRPLADRGHGQGRAGPAAARRRPRPGPQGARRPGGAGPRRARRRAVHRDGRARHLAARRDRRRPGGPGRRQRRGRPAGRGRRGALAQPGAVRLDDPRGGHQHRAAQQGPARRGPARPGQRGDPRRRGGRTSPPTATGRACPACAGGPRRWARGSRSAAATTSPDSGYAWRCRHDQDCCSPTTRPWSAARWPPCSTWNPTCKVVAEVGRGDEVLDAARAHDVDVALLDVEMPGMDGVAAARELHRRAAAAAGC